jgi:hypothetical protein
VLLQGALKARQAVGLVPKDLASCCLAAVMAWEAEALKDPAALLSAKHLVQALKAGAAAEDSQVRSCCGLACCCCWHAAVAYCSLAVPSRVVQRPGTCLEEGCHKESW